MGEEQRTLMGKWLKRGTALLLTVIMVVEQVPWNVNVPVWAKADAFLIRPV